MTCDVWEALKMQESTIQYSSIYEGIEALMMSFM